MVGDDTLLAGLQPRVHSDGLHDIVKFPLLSLGHVEYRRGSERAPHHGVEIPVSALRLAIYEQIPFRMGVRREV